MLKAGTRIGPYEVVSLVGAGGMGEVWRARDDRLQRDVAIKVLPAAFAEDPERLRLFEREARATAALAHPNIHAIFDIGTHEGQPYLVEELLAGESLRERLMIGPLSVSKAVELAAQIAAGLAAAHSRGIVHRDVKPENLFLTSGGVKILDFGLAKLARPDSELGPASEIATATVGSQPGTVLGTVGYAAPEQLRGQPVDHRTDVFAFGCVLYEMLSGRRAFHGETQADTITAILSKDPPPLATPEREIPPALQGIVARCLEKSPEDRFQSTRDLAFNLTQLSRRSGVGTGPLVPAAAEVKPAKPPWALMAMALAGMAAVAAGGVFFGRRTAEVPTVKATRLTFRRGLVTAARFAQDGKTVVYSATWDGAPTELFSLRLGTPEATPLGYTKTDLLAVSASGELALLRNPLSPMAAWLATQLGQTVTLATAPLSGGTPKDLEDSMCAADYSPDGKAMAVARWGPNGGIEYPLGSALKRTEVEALRISRDGRRVAFQRHDDIAVLEPDGEIKTLVRGIPPGRGFAWSPRGNEIWYVDGNELRAMTPGGRQRVLHAHTTALALHDVAPDGRILAAAVEQRSRVFFRGASDVTDRELTWLDWTLVGDVSADGKWIAFFESGLAVGVKPVVYLRETSGAPPMRLGEGHWPLLSADGRFVVAVREEPKEIVVYPVGAGPVRKIPFGEVDVFSAGLLPDGKSLLLVGTELEKVGKAPGRNIRRMWLTDLDGSKPRPLTPEGVFYPTPLFTHDGQYVLTVSFGKKPALYPLAGGEPRPILGLEEREKIAGFSADGRSAFVVRTLERPIPVFRLDLGTGRRELVREIMPADRSGTNVVNLGVRMAADGRTYVSAFHQLLSELYLIEGLR